MQVSFGCLFWEEKYKIRKIAQFARAEKKKGRIQKQPKKPTKSVRIIALRSHHSESNQGHSDVCNPLQSDALPTELW